MIRIGILVLAVLAPATQVLAQYAGRDPAECAQLSTATVRVVPYQIRESDRGCTRIARHHFGDRRRYDLIHQYNPNLGPAPHRFRPGTYICLPESAATAPQPAAQITALRQSVRHRSRAAADWRSSSLGQEVQRGTRVNALESAFAELTFQDSTVLTLRSDTLVVVYGTTSSSVRRSGTEAVLERGTLRTRLSSLRRGRRFEVRTPSSRIELGSGAAVTSVDRSDATRVSNHDGAPAAVRGARGGPAVRLPPGMGSKVLRGRRPTPPRPLPAAPTWQADQVARFVGLPGRTTVQAVWDAVEVAQTYQVEVTRRAAGGENADGSSGEVVAQAEVPNTVTRVELHNLPAGRYVATVATVDSDSFESRPSDGWEFEVLTGELLLPDGTSSEASFETVEQEVPPMDVPLGGHMRAPDGVRCALGEQSPASEVAFSSLGEASLNCVDAEDRSLGAIDVRVTGILIAVVGSVSRSGPVTVLRGQEQAVDLTLETNMEIPDGAQFAGSEGLQVIDAAVDGTQHHLRLRSTADAPHLGRLVFGASAESPLAEIAVEVHEPEPVAPEPEIVAETRRVPKPWTQSFGTVLLPSVAGLRDGSRDGIGGWLTAGYFGPAHAQERLRGSAGVHAALFERQLHLEVAAAFDFVGEHTRTAQTGSGDLYGAVGYRLPLESVDVLLEAGALFPTQPDSSGIGTTRLIPSVHVGFPIEDTVLLRTRQGAAVDLSDNGNASWVSAYGVEVRPVNLLNIGAELDLTLGQEDNDLLLLPLAGASVGLTFESFVVSAGVRFGLSEEAREVLGLYAVVLTVEVGFWRSLTAEL